MRSSVSEQIVGVRSQKLLPDWQILGWNVRKAVEGFLRGTVAKFAVTDGDPDAGDDSGKDAEDGNRGDYCLICGTACERDKIRKVGT